MKKIPITKNRKESSIFYFLIKFFDRFILVFQLVSKIEKSKKFVNFSKKKIEIRQFSSIGSEKKKDNF